MVGKIGTYYDKVVIEPFMYQAKYMSRRFAFWGLPFGLEK